MLVDVVDYAPKAVRCPQVPIGVGSAVFAQEARCDKRKDMGEHSTAFELPMGTFAFDGSQQSQDQCSQSSIPWKTIRPPAACEDERSQPITTLFRIPE